MTLIHKYNSQNRTQKVWFYTLFYIDATNNSNASKWYLKSTAITAKHETTYAVITKSNNNIITDRVQIITNPHSELGSHS